MLITTIKTPLVKVKKCTLIELVERAVLSIPEKSILVVTSKVVSLCEGSAVPRLRQGFGGQALARAEKDALIRKESDYYIPSEKSKWGITLTLTRNILIPSAGIDESNADGHYLLWPRNPQENANALRAHLARRFRRRALGVLITDSKTAPLRRGTTGIALAHSGFDALTDYVGSKDLFGRPFRVSRRSVIDGLAATAVCAMGEGSERTPLALVSDIPFVRFRQRNPTKAELDFLHIQLKEDLYASLLRAAPFRRGGGEASGKKKRRS
ncbi:MAG: hypothetical protein A3C08_00520 [Candidatus Taylorbacteria bacterium RIFCSPHIGHO2_02_FULL_47_18]|uniref:Coenzyme F420:L-glutamate ligase-like domain-containing protein n=1 Tax=Candidatus Taylorbacteria bacterium RIFCSPLOWO2_01_FULL_48_100 TaxID=1802322 RepID=A0A1G2NFB2_9BACT|nr:MAG: hypothetical protein A2670_00235 [Candidatus Taylorbacteria bacterium RIFCSPHIGHO2_01_FULL_48_38]OHA27843.1 MAG: hypothetical protein A3C08_00520 [Candidatus Taylorbacteria bacterium RIFCSPHIGHO2_02_FULL_47_18]OHA34777.1 MAG: hypothetical protein A2938_03670 [Candidatus Taylorbacteria bacterium RIFCSPLOWO2_01_FULL_48_100]OHA40929.1 MAG: hypothetical protein A3J31_03970 [Candidatus Taylorbacteria bacterium RIFCSPLOWO2_02_FULL_48_16]OHA45060.1 MAG: hypothetical protein A3H13_02610 [Candid